MNRIFQWLKGWFSGPNYFEAFSNRLSGHLKSLSEDELAKLCEEARVKSLDPVSNFGQMERLLYQLIRTYKTEKENSKRRGT